MPLYFLKMLNKEQKVQECDANAVEKSTPAWLK